MSVLGEFRRVAGDAASCLRKLEAVAAQDLTVEIEAAIAAGQKDLSSAAARVLELLERAEPDGFADDEHTRTNALENLDRLRAMCRAVLGRG
jgi:hypothetical protein